MSYILMIDFILDMTSLLPIQNRIDYLTLSSMYNTFNSSPMYMFSQFAIMSSQHSYQATHVSTSLLLPHVKSNGH